MQNKGLLFWILNVDKQPLYVNASGNIEAGTGVFKSDGVTPAHLQFSPDGWNETLVKWGRSNKYLGLFREFSAPLNFVKDGAKILKWAMWTYGIEATLYVSISKLDRTQFPDKYDQWYTGELDFSKYRQTETGIDINIMEGGLSKLLKAHEGTSYEVPIFSDTERRSLYLDGMPFRNEIEWSIFGDQRVLVGDILIGCGIVSQEGTSQGVAVQDGPYTPYSAVPDAWITQVVNKDLVFNFYVNVKIKMTSTSLVEVNIIKSDKDGVEISRHLVSSATYTAGSVNYIENSISVNVSDGENCFIETCGAGIGGEYYVLGGIIRLNYNVTFDETLCECITWMRLFEKLTEKVTGGKYGCRSNFLSSLDDAHLITSGQAIRQYKSEAVIKTNFNDFFKACQRWGVGLGIENNQLIIERHEYFFCSNTAIYLGEIKDLEISFTEDLGFNTIKAGYTNQTYDNVNGKYEFNVTQQRNTPITRNVKELDLICPYRADMMGIELTRLRLFQQDTTDNKADNETFIVNATKGSDYNYYKGTFQKQINTGSYFILIPVVLFQLPNGQVFTISGNDYTVLNTSYLIVGFTLIQVAEPVTAGTYNTNISIYDSEVYHLNRPAYSPLTGLLFPDEAFNIEYSPVRSILNNAAYIHSILDKQDAGILKFEAGEKNSDLVAGIISEKGDISIYGLPAKLFLPYYAKFKTKVEVDLPGIMRLKPYDKVSFDFEGNTYTGFVWDAGMAPADDDAQTWQLLMAPENDMKKLI